MAEITISLASIKYPGIDKPIMNPFWFSTEDNIHLSRDTKQSLVVDTDKLKDRTLFEIRNAMRLSLINVDKVEEFEKLFTTDTIDKQATQEKQEIPPSDKIEVKKPKSAILTDSEKAKKLLSLTVAKIIENIGSAEIIDGHLQSGISDFEYLKTLLTIETNGKNRKNIINAIKARMDSVAQVNVLQNSNSLEDFEDVDEEKFEITEDGKINHLAEEDK